MSTSVEMQIMRGRREKATVSQHLHDRKPGPDGYDTFGVLTVVTSESVHYPNGDMRFLNLGTFALFTDDPELLDHISAEARRLSHALRVQAAAEAAAAEVKAERAVGDEQPPAVVDPREKVDGMEPTDQPL